jgi:hypothetical protein
MTVALAGYPRVARACGRSGRPPPVDAPPLRLPDPCLAVLVGATAAGKSHWAKASFAADQIVSSDALRAVVGTGERDQRASRCST